MRAAARIVVAALAIAAGARAQTRVIMLTMSPGDGVAERFGHSAVMIDRDGARVVYNYGTFDGNDPQLVRKFLGHELMFWVSAGSWRSTQAQYARRSITLQELDLDDAQAERLALGFARAASPSQVPYHYHFFRDNCTTRLRDAVADAVPELRATGQAKAGNTFRSLALGILDTDALYRRGVDLALNAAVDGPTTRWDDAFLPREFARLLRDTRLADGRPLVKREWSWSGPLHRPQDRSPPWDAAIACALVGLLGIGALDGGRRRATRTVSAIGLVLFALAVGAVGIGVAVTSLTPYDIARANGNLVAVSPLALVLAPDALLLAVGRATVRRVRRLRVLLVALAAPIAIDLALHLFGVARQHHLAVVAFVAVGLALAFVGLRRAAAPPPSIQG